MALLSGLTRRGKIGEANNLTDEEIADFQTELALILVGVENPKDFADNIEMEIGLDKAESEKLAQEVMDKIIPPIGDKIEERVKNTMKNKDAKWSQNVDFVLSGGNYSAFAEQPGTTNISVRTDKKIILPVRSESEAEDLKNKFTI